MANDCNPFRYHPRWQEMEATLKAAGLSGPTLTQVVEMLERRDCDLERWLQFCIGGATGPQGIKRTDLYDDFTSGVGNPPPPAETGQAWTVSNGPFQTFYQQGLYQGTGGLGYGTLLADSAKSNVRIRSRIYPSTTFTRCGLVFRAGASGSLLIRFSTRGGGGGGENLVDLILRTGSDTTLASGGGLFTIGTSVPMDIDLTSKGNVTSVLINGTVVINYTGTTAMDAQTQVGFYREATTYGAYEDGNNTAGPSHMSYIWVTDAP